MGLPHQDPPCSLPRPPRGLPRPRHTQWPARRGSSAPTGCGNAAEGGVGVGGGRELIRLAAGRWPQCTGCPAAVPANPFCPLPLAKPHPCQQLPCAHLPSKVPHFDGHCTLGDLAHVKAHLKGFGSSGEGQVRGSAQVAFRHGSAAALAPSTPTAGSSAPFPPAAPTAPQAPAPAPAAAHPGRTVGIMSSWNDPVVSTLTRELLPAFCSPISDSSISRWKNRL
jgi:hypothetical protein